MFTESRIVICLRVFLVLLFAILIVFQTVSLPGQFAHMAEVSPDLAYLRWPMTAVSVFLILCAQVIVVSTWRLLTLVAEDQIFTEGSMKWVNAIVASLAAAGVVFLGLAIYVGWGADDPSTPLILILLLTVGAVLGLVILVLRSLLRRATALRTDMEGVI
jgi:Protein of unknown function (DUF2975)